MIRVHYTGHDFRYEFENLMYVFFNKDEIEYVNEGSMLEQTWVGDPDKYRLQQDLKKEKGHAIITTQVWQGPDLTYNQTSQVLQTEKDAHHELRQVKKAMKLALYDGLSTLRPARSPWGILVGMRPVKLVHDMLDAGLDYETIGQILHEEYRIHHAKSQLVLEIAKRERPFIYPVDENALSIYLCMPFCPTRCLYCSFPSNPLDKKAKLVTPYFEALLKEVRETGQMIKDSGKVVDCIYFGGGTPTSLEADQLQTLFRTLFDSMPVIDLKEFSVEAGRPDTITADKLQVMKHFGVDRICINPQSMVDQTLKEIGRSHKAQAIEEVYHLAKTFDFKTINMDIIIGLPGEGDQEVSKTMSSLAHLKPENVTIHTLSVKRSSQLKNELSTRTLTDGDTIETMMDVATGAMRDQGYVPYYMYRQKNILANLENIGYSKPGHESLYNMRIMEERHSIIAMGAGSVSKMCFPSENRFERVANSKGVEDYIDRVDEMIKKKEKYLR